MALEGVYGYAVDSEFPLTRLRPAAADRGRLSVRGSARDPLAESADIFQLSEEADGSPLLALARTPRALLAWCADAGSARVEADRGLIWAHPEADPEAFEDRLLNLLIPMLLAERGQLVLHAAAVLTQAGAMVICGPSGRGKSTLAAALGAQGLPVLCEDTVALDPRPDAVWLWPGPSGVRLQPRAATALGVQFAPRVRGKLLHRPPLSEAAPVPVAAVVALGPRGGEGLRLDGLDPAAALVEVFTSVLRLEPERWRAPFHRTAQLVTRVPCHLARFADDLEQVIPAAGALAARIAGQRAA